MTERPCVVTGGGLAGFMGHHLVALAETTTVYWEKSGAPGGFADLGLCLFSKHETTDKEFR